MSTYGHPAYGRSHRGTQKCKVRINRQRSARHANCYDTFSMSFALGLLVLTCGSLAAIAHQLRRAPEAFEDETGFHFSSSTGNRLSAESGLPLGAGADVRAALFQAPQNVSRRREAPNSIGTAARRAPRAH